MTYEADRPAPAALDSAGRQSGRSPGYSSYLLSRVKDALAPRYDVTDVIGSGGMAVVFRAHEPRHGRNVAIKVVRPELTASMASDRFLREIEVTARLQHPHIVGLFDSGTVEDLVYYVMPHVEGESLRALLKREVRLSVELALQLTRELASALDYAHSRGIVHRDLKPENVLLSSGHAMLADFGIAGALERVVDQKSFTEDGILIGTPEYMSPEQCSGTEKVDGRSDIYSLGCVLYEMLAGEPPFTGRTPQVVMARHASERLPSIEVVRPDVPPRLITIASKALAKAPADRYQTAGALDRALTQAEAPPSHRARWIAGAGVVSAVAMALYFGPKAGAPVLDANKVAVFPMAELGLSEAEAGAGMAVAVMINTALEHADPLRPLDVLERIPPSQAGEIVPPHTRRSIARDVGAAHYITGVVQGHADSITVALRLYDVRGDSIVVQRSASGQRGTTPLHRVGIDAVKALLPALVDPGRAVELATLRDRRASAVALFIQGERAYRRSAFPDALGFYQRAIAADSALAIAAIKGALAAYFQDHRATAELAQYAVERDSLLPPRYAAFARGLRAFSLGQADSAEAWLAVAIDAAPGWPEALMQLGEVFYHLIPLRASRDSLAEIRFAAAAAADSGFSPPLIHLAEIAIRKGRLGDARQLIDRLDGMRPTAAVVSHLRMMEQCASQGARRFDWAPDVKAQPVATLRAAKALAAAGHQLPCAESAFRAALSLGPDSLRWGAAFGLQSVLAAQQRTADVISLVDSVSQAGALQVLMTAYLVDIAAGLPVQQQATAVALFGQARWGPRYAGLAGAPGREWLEWLFGTWHARSGDLEIVASLRSAIEARNVRNPQSATRMFADALGAHQALLSGDTARAIERLRRLNPAVPNDSITWSMSLPVAIERIKLAELLLARRDYAGAIGVASVFDHPEPMVYVAFLPASLSIRQRAAEALGQRQAADEFRSRLERMRQVQPAVRRG